MAILGILLTSTDCGFPYCQFMCVQGKADNFLADKQLLPENLMEACTSTKTPIILRMQEVGVHFSRIGGGGGVLDSWGWVGAESEVKTGV